MGAAPDRNGLRSARYFQLNDGTTVVSSEAGILEPEPAPADLFRSKGRVGPGKMAAIDLHTGELIEDDATKGCMAQKKPYTDWNRTFREALPEVLFLGNDKPLAVVSDRPASFTTTSPSVSPR